MTFLFVQFLPTGSRDEPKLKEEIKNIEEPRRTRYGNIRHKLEDILIIGLRTVICGGEDYTDMEGFGIEREDFLRNFLELPNGIPDSDTLRRIFERLKPVEEKTNEITAVPQLLDLIDVKGAIVTADAMSCQKSIVKKIIDCKADCTMIWAIPLSIAYIKTKNIYVVMTAHFIGSLLGNGFDVIFTAIQLI